jgi:hypothetical protein
VALDAQAATLVYIEPRITQIAVNQTSFYATLAAVFGRNLASDKFSSDAWTKRRGCDMLLKAILPMFIEATIDYVFLSLPSCLPT